MIKVTAPAGLNASHNLRSHAEGVSADDRPLAAGRRSM
jgi:hypothetical protein